MRYEKINFREKRFCCSGLVEPEMSEAKKVSKPGTAEQSAKNSGSGCLAAIVALIVILSMMMLLSKNKPTSTQAEDAEDVEQTIARLKEAESALQDLVIFVRDQQAKVRESQSIVDSLKSEHEKLKPVVDADHKIVDAVLAAESERHSINVWQERAFGFVSGMLASLIAAYIWEKFKQKPSPQPLAVPGAPAP
jgi:hypothetical protein